MRWVVTSVPAWIVGIVVVGGIPALAIVAEVFLSRKVPTIKSGSHNDVAGFLVAVVAVIYAVIVGFTIVSLYETSVTANDDVSAEAASLLQLHEGDFVLGPATSARIDADIVGYARAVVRDWTTISRGVPSREVQSRANHIYATLSDYRPRTAAERDYLNQAIIDVNSLTEARVTRQLEAKSAGTLPPVLWTGILLTSLVTLGFALMFSLENLRFACTMVGGVALVLSVNLFMLIELGYPFLGSVAVGPDRFVDVIHLVGG